MKKSLSEEIFNVVNIIFMLLLCFVTLYPYWNQVAISFNEGADAMKGGITLFPRVFTLQNYYNVLKNDSFSSAVLLTVSIVILNVCLSLFMVYSAAYVLTRKGLPYRKGLTLFLMIPSYISAGVIPVYMLYRYLGLINNYWVYILPGLFSFYNMVILRSFLQEIPASLEESAKLDGAGEYRIMFSILIPLSLPVIATIALWISVGSWNSWMTTLYYVTNKKLFTVQYLMMRLIKESEVAQQMAAEAAMTGSAQRVQTTPDTLKAATLVLTTLPIIMAYPFAQKYFIKGISLGAVKE